jgi:hypothetical protein
LTNTQDKDLLIVPSAFDFYTLPENKKIKTTDWLQIKNEEFSLKQGESKTIKFVVDVPKKAKGELAGNLRFESRGKQVGGVSLSLSLAIYAAVTGTEKIGLTYPAVGQEFWVHSVLALRAGYETGINRVTVGVGIRQNQFSLDYAFLTQADFTEQHQMNVSYRWGNIATPEVEKPVAPRRRVEKKTAPPQPTKKAPRPAEKPAPQVEPEEKAVPEPARTPTAPSPKRRFQLN